MPAVRSGGPEGEQVELFVPLAEAVDPEPVEVEPVIAPPAKFVAAPDA